ncbi:SSI family serine proteinase inhibitor [Planosporangium flavigriseum]|uniref:SSI family serine proteinase inhibitor n=1 Tax=Planosporangium flavigriseum TaxID=373681 RepID=UPI0031DEAE23
MTAPSAATLSAARTTLLLTAARGEDGDRVDRTAVLTCAPAGGTHPAASQACGELSSVAGEVAALSEGSGSCILMYDPVTVTLRGWWQGEEKYFRATYSNSCVLHRQTHAVFDF